MTLSPPATPTASTSSSSAASIDSRGSEATTAPTSPSRAPESRARNGSTTRRPIQWQDRVLVTGDSGTGKSHLVKALYLSAPPGEHGRKLIIDPQDSTLLAGLPGHRDFSDPKRWPEIGRLARFVPRDPFDLEVYGELYRRALAVGRVLALTDEAGQVCPSRAAVPRSTLVYNGVGRKRLCGNIMCHLRPVEIDPRWTSTVQHAIGFDLPLPEDRRRFAAIAGIPPAELHALMDALEKYSFIWSDRQNRSITVCPPIAA